MSDPDVVRNESNGKRVDFPWGRIVWLADRDLTGDSCGLTFGIVTIAAGERNVEHLHPNCDELVYVERGRIEHSLDDRRFALGPGDMLHVPRNRPHGARNIGDAEARLIVVYDTARREIRGVEGP